jgi:DNA-binding beta-propeller fold protein YncE
MTDGSAGEGYATSAYAADSGRELWVARYRRFASAEPAALAVSPDGLLVYMTGWAPGRDGRPSYLTLAYRSDTGAEVWTALYSADEFAVASAIAASPDGESVYVTGASGARGSFDHATVAYDSQTGRELWVSRNERRGGFDEPVELAVSPDAQRVYVTGTFASADEGYDYATVAVKAATGEQVWLARYDGPSRHRDTTASLAVSPDGSRVYVTGSSTRLYGGGKYAVGDIATIAYRATTGARLWVVRHKTPASILPPLGTVHASNDAAALAVSPDGTRLSVTGGSGRWKRTGSNGAEETNDFGTVAYRAATGTKLWVARYNGPRDDFDSATSLAVSPDGTRVYVTGWSDTPDSGSAHDVSAYATVAYSASNGRKLWVARYSGPVRGHNAPDAIAVASDGSRVYVTGSSQASDKRTGFVTIAYRAR